MTEVYFHLITLARDLNIRESFSFFTCSTAVNNKKYGVKVTIKNNTDGREYKSRGTSTGQVPYITQKGRGYRISGI